MHAHRDARTCATAHLLSQDIWEAVFGPRGSDGYPQRVWCKDPNSQICEYGEINASVVSYWREHYDMTERLRSGWAAGLGDKLNGKLHVYVGGSDTFFLTNAVPHMCAYERGALISRACPPISSGIIAPAV